jgi:hypothetical protein
MNKLFAVIAFAVVLLGASYGSYNYGRMVNEEEWNEIIPVFEEREYKRGQLDAFNGIQLYEKASFEDGTVIVMERNDKDSNI